MAVLKVSAIALVLVLLRSEVLRRDSTCGGGGCQHLSMAYEAGLAETDEQKEAVYRFRYTVYVEEMGRYQGGADHTGRRLVEPEDEPELDLLRPRR